MSVEKIAILSSSDEWCDALQAAAGRVADSVDAFSTPSDIHQKLNPSSYGAIVVDLDLESDSVMEIVRGLAKDGGETRLLLIGKAPTYGHVKEYLELGVGEVLRKPGNLENLQGVLGLVSDDVPSLARSSEIRKFEFTIDGEDESLEEAVQVLSRLLSNAGLKHSLEFNRMITAAYEVLANAVEHGNQGNKELKVHVHYHWCRGRLKVVIEDQGEGFDPELVPNPLQPQNLLKDSGRGLLIIRKYADMLRFEEDGTRIIFEKDLSALIE